MIHCKEQYQITLESYCIHLKQESSGDKVAWDKIKEFVQNADLVNIYPSRVIQLSNNTDNVQVIVESVQNGKDAAKEIAKQILEYDIIQKLPEIGDDSL